MGKNKKQKKKKRNSVKRNYKDSVFRDLFNDEQALKELYGALTDCQIGDNEPIKIVTLKDAIHNDLKNDLAFTLGSKIIVMIEQQSTDSPNLPLRLFCYLAAQYEKMLDQRVYSTAKFTIPRPELYVFYNGKSDREEEWEQRLSDLFAVAQDNPVVEVIVKVININYEKGAAILKKSKTLNGYSMLLHKVQQHLDENYELEPAMQMAIQECIEENVIADYLRENGRKVMSILKQNLTEKQKKELWEGIGREEGRVEEREKLTHRHALMMKSLGVSWDIIENVTGLSQTAIEAL